MPNHIGAASFNADITAFIRQAQLSAETVVRRIVLQVWKEVTKRTPVDTGRARAAWITNLDEPSEETPPEGTYGAPSAPDLSHVTLRNRIFVTNNVSYILHLEDGSSQQAPAGMVRISLAQVQAELETLIAQAATPTGGGGPTHG